MAQKKNRAVVLLKLVGALVVAGVLVAAVAVPFIAGAGMATRTVADDFNTSTCDLDLAAAQPSQRTVIYAANNKPITYLYRQNREIVKASDIPDVMRKALVSIEDRRFYEHHGVDTQGMLRALVRTSSGDTQGASTLTQQYVKQLQLYSAKTEAEAQAAIEQTLDRKLKEARCALDLEKKQTKDEILTGYLNIANFGAGAYGVKTASRTYFNKQPKDLTVAEAALLAGLAQSPTRYNPFNHPEAAKARRGEVIAALLRDGKITSAQAAEANKAALPTTEHKTQSVGLGCANATGGTALNIGFFCDYVVDYLKNKLGMTEDQLYTGGYSIYTTLDADMQLKSQQSVMSHMGAAESSVGVLDLVEPSTGKVRAMAISRGYGTGARQTTIGLGYKAVAPAGSTYKVFTLLAAMQDKVPLRAYKLNTPNNEYTTVNCPQHNTVHNAGHYADSLDMETATYQSSNTFFTALIDQHFKCDLTKPVDMAINLGLDSYVPLRQQTIDSQEVSFTLGVSLTSPLEMASAYGTLANDGKHCPATPIEKILDNRHRTVDLKSEGCKQVVSPGIAHTATLVLQKDTSAEAGGSTASVAHIPGYATAGKTGTHGGFVNGETVGNAAMWFIGFTPNLSGSAAVFNPKSTSIPVRDIPGYIGQDLYGGKAAAPIWKDAMVDIQQKFPEQAWPPEDPDVVDGDAVDVPSVVGLDIAAATAKLQAEGFPVQVGAAENADGIAAGLVARQTPSGKGVKGQTVTIFPSTGQPKTQPTGTPTSGAPPSNPGNNGGGRGGGNGGGNGGGGPGNGGGGGGG